MFRASCPVSPKAQAWIESCFEWLCSEFGEQVLGRTPLLPAEVLLLPRGADGGPSLTQVLSVVCDRLAVNSDNLDVEVFDGDPSNELRRFVPMETRSSGAAAHYRREGDRFKIGVSEDQLHNLISLTASLAHELAHVRLLGESRIDPHRPDQEQLTDLTTVFFGMGIFNANAAFDFAQDTYGWSTKTLGYLGEEMFGYALAVYAHSRGEQKPQWAAALDTNPKTYMRRGLRFLRKASSDAS